jgi:hypothetical protein
MPVEAPTFEWEEVAGVVTVRLPAPPLVPPSMTWTTAILTGAAIFLFIPTLLLLFTAVANVPRGPTFWWVLGAAILAEACLAWRAITAVRREASAPGTPLEPAVLSLTADALKIERAGLDRGTDVSWERWEVADLRMCNAAPDRVFLGLQSLVKHALSADDVLRVSVERPSGDVNDVFVLTRGRGWADALELRVRTHLGLPPP